MIEYKAYHKKSLGKPKRRHAAPRKGKGAGEAAPARWRAALPAALAVVALAAASGAVLAVYAWLSHSRLFAVRVLDVNEGGRVPRDEVAAILKGVPGGNIFRLPAEQIGRRLLEHPFVERVSVRKALPDRLVVRIAERRPVAMINLDALFYVDERGRVFKRLTAYDPKEFPIITGFSPREIGARDPVALSNLARTVELLRLVESGTLRRNISEAHYDPLDGYSLVTRDRGVRIRVGTLDVAEALRRIEEAMPKVAGLGRDATVVDLRTEGRIYVRRES